MNKLNIIGVIAVIALLLGGWALSRPSQMASIPTGAISNSNAPAANTSLVNAVLLPNPTVLDYLVSRVFLYADKAIGFGNSSGTAILQQGARQAMVASSSVVCSLQNPYSTATSTYEMSFNISSTSASAASVIVAVGANTGATTTLQGTFSVAANAQAVIGTSGTTTSGSVGIVGPSLYVNVGALTGGSAALSQYGGVCDAIFTSTN